MSKVYVLHSKSRSATTPIAVAHIFTGCGKAVPYDDCRCLRASTDHDSPKRMSNTQREGFSTSANPQCQPPIVMRKPLVDVILVMSYDQFAHAEAAGALSDTILKKAPSISCSVVCYDFNHQQYLLVVLDLLDRIFWVFLSVIVAHPMSSLSRARHVGEGQWPLRSRAHPFGLPSLSAADSDRVLRADQVLEIASWLCHVTLRSKQFTYLLLMMPEDIGGHHVSGPASPWDLEEFHSLQGVNEAARGAAFLSASLLLI